MKLKSSMVLLLILLFAFKNAHSEEAPGQTINLTLPELSWALEIEAPGFVVSDKGYDKSIEGIRFFATNEKTGVVMSAFLEKAPKEGDAKECRSYYWERGKKSPSKKDDLRMWESGDRAFLEYMIKNVMGVKLDQENQHAYLSKDGYWIDIHLSKVNFEPADESLFEAILDKARIRDKSSYSNRQTVRYYAIPERGALTLNVPENWADEIRRPGTDLPPTITFEPILGKSFTILITVYWSAVGKADYNSPENIKLLIKQRGEELLPTAEETKLTLRKLRGDSGLGYYFSFTDKVPKPGEYKYLNQGSLSVEDLLLGFTILTNKKDSEVVGEALAMLSNARQQAPSKPVQEGRSLKCWKCKKPFEAPKDELTGKCPYCGERWKIAPPKP